MAMAIGVPFGWEAGLVLTPSITTSGATKNDVTWFVPEVTVGWRPINTQT